MSKHFWLTIAFCLSAFAGVCWVQSGPAAAPLADKEPTLPARQIVVPKNARTAIFAGGCFWSVQETLRVIPGVVETKAGYTGGHTINPTYESLHTNTTGHVEAVEVTYDPAVVTFDHLVALFLGSHNPTLPDHEGQAIGKQYRSFVFCTDKPQIAAAQAVIHRLEHSGGYPGAPKPIVTQIRRAGTFWPAEEHHQFYYEKRGMNAACAL